MAVGAAAAQQPPSTQTPQPARPPACAEDPLFGQQDFTLGKWEVFRGDTKSAEVTMEKVNGGCGIFETWTPAGGRPTGHGKGIFAYSRIAKGWQYFWISDRGDTTLFDGALIAENHIRYVTEYWTRDNKKRINHWDLIKQPDGSVREFSVVSDDLGNTWRTEYDLYWRKSK
jgi:hypothetical protein